MISPRRAGRYAEYPTHGRHDAMRKLTFDMNVSLDGYIAAHGDDLGWSVPSDELFQWWSDRVGATGTALDGGRLGERRGKGRWGGAGGGRNDPPGPRQHPGPAGPPGRSAAAPAGGGTCR